MPCGPPGAAGYMHAPPTPRQPRGGRPSEGGGPDRWAGCCPCRSAGGDCERQFAYGDFAQRLVALLDDVRALLARVQEDAHLG